MKVFIDMAHHAPSTAPIIGIFDSGLGGLTVTRSIMKLLPHIPVVYFGDTARFPYGSKSKETVSRYAIENTIFLMEKHASIIVVACNTATSVALPLLQKTFSVPIFGVIEPAAMHAVATTKNKRIGVIGTTGTVRSKSYEKALKAIDPDIVVFSKACPLLVTLIEEGSPHVDLSRAIIRAYINPLLQRGIDTLLLGCTHYPLIKEEIQRACGEGVTLIDPAETCSAIIHQRISAISPTPGSSIPPESPSYSMKLYASDDAHRFRKIGGKFLGFSFGRVAVKRI